MEQLSFDFTTLVLKIKGKKLLLDEWQTFTTSNNWIRKLRPYDGFSCIGLMVSWAYNGQEYSFDKYHWLPMFHGSDLFYLNEIYKSFYPDKFPTFQNYQLKEAKQHLDDFINRVNSLKVFL